MHPTGGGARGATAGGRRQTNQQRGGWGGKGGPAEQRHPRRRAAGGHAPRGDRVGDLLGGGGGCADENSWTVQQRQRQQQRRGGGASSSGGGSSRGGNRSRQRQPQPTAAARRPPADQGVGATAGDVATAGSGGHAPRPRHVGAAATPRQGGGGHGERRPRQGGMPPRRGETATVGCVPAATGGVHAAPSTPSRHVRVEPPRRGSSGRKAKSATAGGGAHAGGPGDDNGRRPRRSNGPASPRWRARLFGVGAGGGEEDHAAVGGLRARATCHTCNPRMRGETRKLSTVGRCRKSKTTSRGDSLWARPMFVFSALATNLLGDACGGAGVAAALSLRLGRGGGGGAAAAAMPARC